MVEYLISTCDADVEQMWSYVDDSDDSEMASPLWYAAENGNTAIIECLLRHGARVNAISSSGTTPVQAACNLKYSKLDALEYLVEHGADIHRANNYGKTCLMAAVYDVKMCEFLLKNGADVNARHNITNATALHDAIDEEMFDTVKLLLDYGADVTLRSLDNHDALQFACVKGFRPIFDYLVEHGSYSPGRLADANELMGSCCNRDTETLEYWRKAIEIRNSNTVDGNPLAKTSSMPKRDCYRNASEFTTLDELDAIALDSDALNIQKLLIHERILGEHHRDTFNALKRIGAMYKTEPFRYQYCFDLWKRALEISVVNDSIFLRGVYDVANNLIQAMRRLHDERTLDIADRNRDNQEQSQFADVVAIFKLLTSRLVTAQPPSEGKPYYHDILKCITGLINLLVKTARTSEAEDEVRALVRRLVNQNPMSPQTHYRLLSHCVSESLVLDFDEINTYLKVTTLLLESGAHVNARDTIDGSTPLHTIARSSSKFSDHIVKLLLDHGAHLDTPDKSGSTPAHILSANPDNTVDLGNYMTLRCLAAQAIVKHELQCNDLPATLCQFLDLHRPL